MWIFLYPFGSFVSGFILMGFEIIASRVIAPLVGNSLYSWASVIGIILFGLSCGAWFGGVRADKENHLQTLIYTLLLSSLFIAIVPFVSLMLGTIPPFSGIIATSLFYCVFLFLPVSFTLGMIQPLLLKEYSLSFKTLGKDYGLLSMLWSLGSIIGVLSMGFVFISLFGTTTILFGLSGVCILYSLLLIFHSRKTAMSKKIIPIFCVTVLFVCGMYTLFPYVHKNTLGSATIFEKDTAYYHLRIVDFTAPQFGFTRSLFLDYDVHSILTEKFVPYIYTDIFPVFKILSPHAKNILAIGAGAYSFPKNVNVYFGVPVDVLEIDPEIPAIVKKYFGYDETMIHNINGEARLFLRTNEKKYDVIFGDVYNSFISLPWYLTTQEYYSLAKQNLSPNGIYVMSFISSKNPSDAAFLQSMITTFRSVYPNTYIFSFIEDPTKTGNIVLIGVNSKTSSRISEEKIKEYLTTAGTYSFLEKTVMTAGEINSLPTSSKTTLLSDDYAPIESLMKSAITAYFKDYSLFVSYIIKHNPEFTGKVINNTLTFSPF